MLESRLTAQIEKNRKIEEKNRELLRKNKESERMIQRKNQDIAELPKGMEQLKEQCDKDVRSSKDEVSKAMMVLRKENEELRKSLEQFKDEA